MAIVKVSPTGQNAATGSLLFELARIANAHTAFLNNVKDGQSPTIQPEQDVIYFTGDLVAP